MNVFRNPRLQNEIFHELHQESCRRSSIENTGNSTKNADPDVGKRRGHVPTIGGFFTVPIRG